MADISRRKADHLDLAATGDVGFLRTSTLFDDVRLVHNALPELDFDAVDTSCRVLGKRLRAPILIAGMTGGTERARAINRELASIAEERGYAFGVGSQRAMHRDKAAGATYAVRDAAPSALVLGNIGVVQAKSMSSDAIAELVGSIGADALCLHLNPAMEIVQPGGDRDFSGALDTFARLVRELPVPVIAKETGCGLSSGVARRLRSVGVRHADVSGAGGTSWVAVEMHRAAGDQKALGEAFREWGIPTAASVAFVAAHGFETIFATGGMQSGLDVAKAIALGATAGGLARPVLQAFERGGRNGALELLARVEAELRAAMLLVGAAGTAALRSAPRVIHGELAAWLAQAT